MIYIDRERLDSDGHRIRPSTHWRNLAEAATHQAIQDGPGHDADSDVYSHDHVRAALEKLFHGKCAYCECKLPGTGWPVEHFRPKGRVAKRPDHPGYYWLAYAWDNLYAACTECNERRRDRPIWEDLTFGTTGGKADHFPLADEADRVMGPGAIDDEVNVLIDPCFDSPEWYLSFAPNGAIFAIDSNEYGAATISILNLKRRRLTLRRETRVKAITELCRIAKGLVDRGDDDPGKSVRSLAEAETLQCKEFAGVTRAVLADPDRFGI